MLRQHRPRAGGRAASTSAPSLFALTGQSNISNSKNPLSLIQYAASQGFCTLLDAAALAPTSVISLADTPVDAMAVSFYKMFGFPTGVGALVASLPLVSVLGMIWLWRDTGDAERLAAHSEATFWFVLPSLPMFLLIPALIRHGIGFPLALLLGCSSTVILYSAMTIIGPRFGLQL